MGLNTEKIPLIVITLKSNEPNDFRLYFEGDSIVDILSQLF